MKRVTYVLGAGFSAPLGVPVMSTFLDRSRDLYYLDPVRYQYFEHVFEQIGAMSVTKNYFRADLFNIEEILSIVEMGSFVQGNALRDNFIRYLKTVIESYTPPLVLPDYLPTNWADVIFAEEERWKHYGFFVLDLCNIRLDKLRKPGGPVYHATAVQNPSTAYAVITLNYDRVLETVVETVLKRYEPQNLLGFQRPPAPGRWNAHRPILAKLHGSIEDASLVPPTWSKGANKEIVPAWAEALNILKESNEIRFIGYSLPAADAYVRYLFKAAGMRFEHLKQIDVLCLDSERSAEGRYREFIEFPRLQFLSGDAADYLENHFAHVVSRLQYHPGRLERAHNEFFGRTGGA